MNDFYLNELISREFTINDSKKLVIKKAIFGNREIVDMRFWVKFANQTLFCPTQKGLFINVLDCKEKVLPTLIEYCGYEQQSGDSSAFIDEHRI